MRTRRPKSWIATRTRARLIAKWETGQTGHPCMIGARAPWSVASDQKRGLEILFGTARTVGTNAGVRTKLYHATSSRVRRQSLRQHLRQHPQQHRQHYLQQRPQPRQQQDRLLHLQIRQRPLLLQRQRRHRLLLPWIASLGHGRISRTVHRYVEAAIRCGTARSLLQSMVARAK